jgi:AcrR family transcriptional regulator
MRTRGWNGALPDSDEEAERRIIAATMRCVDRYGDKTGLADVAAELGVTRQTVYRYFPSTEELFRATSVAAAGDFLDRMVDDLSGLDDPGEIVVEAVMYSIERLSQEKYLSLLIAGGHREVFLAEITSPMALEFGRALFRRLPVDWDGLGYDQDSLADLVELAMRLLQSFLLDPGQPPRSPAEQRRYLRRWLAPAVVTSPRTAEPSPAKRDREDQLHAG